MIIHLTKDQLEWVEIQHHEELSHGESVESVIQAEVFYYKNDDITVRSTIKIIEHSDREYNFEVLTHSYAHVHPGLVRMEFGDGKNLGEYKTQEEAKFAAQVHFNHHHHIKYHH
jgi:hypothetical protein